MPVRGRERSAERVLAQRDVRSGQSAAVRDVKTTPMIAVAAPRHSERPASPILLVLNLACFPTPPRASGRAQRERLTQSVHAHTLDAHRLRPRPFLLGERRGWWCGGSTMTRAGATMRAVGEEQYTCSDQLRATRDQRSESGRSGVKGTRKRTEGDGDGGQGRRECFEDDCVLA